MTAYPVGSRSGPLSGLGARFRSSLGEAGYSANSMEALLAVWWDLNRWLTGERLAAGEWAGAQIARFGDARRVAGHGRYVTVAGLAPLVGFFVSEALVMPPVTCPTALEAMLGAYRRWLVEERALASRTVARYQLLAERFLGARYGSGLGVEGLCGADVTRFVLDLCSCRSAASAKVHVGELRSLLRFLYLEGHIPFSLADTVPGVAVWHATVLPPTCDAGQVMLLLNSCDRGTVTGRRDFAILTLLARLGLRSAEVAGLWLEDLDWRAGEIVVRGKGDRVDRLPMPWDVGDALVGYLNGGRPVVSCREVFLRRRAPLIGIDSTTVTTVVHFACRRAGLATMGAHRLRHALAAQLLATGAGLPEVAQLLRHRDLASTAVYAKVDRVALGSLARPWPKGVS